ncbi:cytochrome P450 6B4-like [Cydia pomonella]|uniref:cytochrome P450 6B4-like n=1 Tax=Cydia pomonella TaxID=82600 RepID=UPI002ADDFD20|nr:cytochrome P450 6B4-like [Cydia pomonella]
MTLIILIITFVICLGYSLYQHFTKFNNYWEIRNVRGPKPTFFFGNIIDSCLRKKPVGVVFKEIYDAYPEEKVVGFFRMRSPDLLLRDLDVVKYVLIKDFDIFTDRGKEYSKSGLGANLFHADSATWRVLRKRFSPMFTSGKLRNMMYLLTERGDRFVEYIDRITKKGAEQEIHGLTQKFTQSAIIACVFGLDLDTFDQQHETLQRIDKKIFSVKYGSELESMYPGILKKIGGWLFPEEVKTFFSKLIKVIAMRNGQPSNRHDFMDLLLELKKENTLDMTDEDIAAQAYIFYAAGYESSASTMGFLLYQLALNQDIQEKLYAEIKEALENNNGEMTYDAIMNLEYMEKVFNETLRMYPIITKLKRRSKAPYKIPETNIIIDKGQLIKISVLGIHHDEKYYPNPEVFDPQRFSPENVQARHKCAFLPFGEGPKQCIGIRFAQMQSWVGLAKLLLRYRVEPSENTPLRFAYEPRRVMLYPKGGFPINIVRRH